MRAEADKLSFFRSATANKDASPKGARQELVTRHGCQIILTNLNESEEYLATYAAGRLRRKLDILGSWINALAELRYKEHENRGYVCVFLSKANGFNVYWVEEEEIVADKAYYDQFGSKVLSVEEATGIILNMMNNLHDE